VSLFGKKKNAVSVPKGCEGLDIRVESSVCTGEKVIGFYDPKTKKLLCSELVRTDEDIKAFYKKYGKSE
jgi:acetyl/propionyl-CoA carboxylase alpha subunit